MLDRQVVCLTGECTCVVYVRVCSPSFMQTDVDTNNVLDWQSSDNPCEWEDVECDEDRENVTALSLTKGELAGGLPGFSSLLGLPALTKLALENNGLRGTLPLAYRQLRGLNELEVFEMQGILGMLPPEWGRGPLADSLTRLRIVKCPSVGGTLPQEWSGMRVLESINLENNALTGTLPSSWANITSLKNMGLQENKISGTLPPEYQSWDRIETLWIFGNPNISGTLPDSWANGMTSITDLQLGGSFVWSSPFVSEKSIQGEGNPDNPERKLLQTDEEAPVEDEHVAARWSYARSDLCKVDSMISGSLPSAWSKLSSLKFLRIQCTKLSGTVPPEWGALENIEVRNWVVPPHHVVFVWCTYSDDCAPLYLHTSLFGQSTSAPHDFACVLSPHQT